MELFLLGRTLRMVKNNLFSLDAVTVFIKLQVMIITHDEGKTIGIIRQFDDTMP